jgi:hypothetical protein
MMRKLIGGRHGKSRQFCNYANVEALFQKNWKFCVAICDANIPQPTVKVQQLWWVNIHP